MNPKIALVTGASRGIGAGIAQVLAKRGMVVWGSATSQAGAESIQLALQDYPGCKGVVLEVTDQNSIKTVLQDLLSVAGGLHILVNNAGITQDNLLLRMTNEDWDKVLATNLTAIFRLCREVVRAMIKQRYGRIINITSVVGSSGNPGQVNYSAAKAGLAGLTRSLALEVASRHITVNCVAPGFIESDMTAKLSAEQQNEWLKRIPLGRMGRSEEVAELVAFLASDQAGYITGQEIHINGGMWVN